MRREKKNVRMRKKNNNEFFPEFCSLSLMSLWALLAGSDGCRVGGGCKMWKFFGNNFNFILLGAHTTAVEILTRWPRLGIFVCRRCVSTSFWMRWKIPHRWHVKTLSVLAWDLVELETSACECKSSSSVQLDSPKKAKITQNEHKKKSLRLEPPHSDTVHIYLAVASSTVAVWTNFFSSSLLSLSHPDSYSCKFQVFHAAK